MMKMKKQKEKKEEGQAIVEFALALPICLLILCGILDFGWIYVNQYKVEYAAFQGARYGAINIESQAEYELTENIRSRAVSNLYGNGEDADIDIVYGSDNVSVTVVYPVRTLTFVGSTLFGTYYDASSTSVSTY